MLPSERIYQPDDLARFAALAGDFNPIHLNEDVARRSQFGQPIVHGVCIVLDAIEAYLGRDRLDGSGDRSVIGVSATFHDPLYVGETARFARDENDGAEITVRAARGAMATVNIKTGPPANVAAELPPHFVGLPREPRDLTIAQMAGWREKIPLSLDQPLFALRYPLLAGSGSMVVAAALLALSRIVGMHCPGRYSLFSSFAIDLHDPAQASLDTQVEIADPRFSYVRMKVAGAVQGSIESFIRPRPQQQPSFAEFVASAGGGRHAGQTALVIGGSRGIGEATAKLIAAEGGQVTITYHQGRDDALRVAQEITAGGGGCRAVHGSLSSLEELIGALARQRARPTHCYYFATPVIFRRKSAAFVPELFAEFAEYYVAGFYRLYQALRKHWPAERLAMFYPSTVALEAPDKGLVEYSAAKAAGESLCASLAAQDSRVRIVVERLPRIGTDQTLTMTKYPSVSAAEAMRGVLDRMTHLTEGC